jgi:hypothetical protein
VKELTGAELRKFVMTATQDEIYQYWLEILAPKYGYTRLVSPTGKVIINLKGGNHGKRRTHGKYHHQEGPYLPGSQGKRLRPEDDNIEG